MKSSINFFTFTIFIFFLLTTNTQAQLFDAGFVVGPSFSQIEGDDVAGYKKIGLNAGVMVEINFSDIWVASMELLYVQKGSATAFVNNQDFIDDFKIVHEYVEIPFILNYQDKGGMNFGAGVVPVYNVRSRRFELGEEIPNFFDPPNEIKKWGLAAALNLSYRINRFSQVNARWTYDVIPYQKRFSNNRQEIVGIYNNSIAIRYIFLMSAIGKKQL